MMQRSDLLAVTLGLATALGAYLFFGELVGLIVGAAVALGALGAVLLLPRPARATAAARVRRVGRARAAPAASIVSMVPAGRASRAGRGGPRFEPAAALAPPELRLTHDILTGMQTGGKTTRGLCSSCGATLWLSARRPLKARCPNCGHTRVLER